MGRQTGNTRFLARLALAVSALLGSFILTSPASAGCSYEEQVFVRSTSLRTATNGSQQVAVLKNRDVDSCSGLLGGVSMAHIASDFTFDNPSGDWVEVGWTIHWLSYPDTKDWDIYTAKGVNFDPVDSTFIHLSPNLDVGTEDRWRVANISGTTEWRTYVDFLLGGDFVLVDTYQTTYGFGVALGESERFGQNSGMSDNKNVLRDKNNLNQWEYWPKMNCVQHRVEGGAAEWAWSFDETGSVDGHSYDVVKEDNSC